MISPQHRLPCRTEGVGVDVWLSELCFVCVGINTSLIKLAGEQKSGERKVGGKDEDMAGTSASTIFNPRAGPPRTQQVLTTVRSEKNAAVKN